MYTVVLEAREPLAVLIASLSINYFFFFFSIQVKNFFMNMGKKQKTTFIVFVFFFYALILRVLLSKSLGRGSKEKVLLS